MEGKSNINPLITKRISAFLRFFSPNENHFVNKRKSISIVDMTLSLTDSEDFHFFLKL